MHALSALAAALSLALAAKPPAAPRDPGEELARLEAELARERRGPRGLVPLAALAEAAEEAPDLARLAVILARTADDRAAHPEVRALARFRLAAVERARGNPQRSAAHLRRLGFVTAWTVAGPFDDEGKRGHDTAYPPERAIDLALPMAGKVREVSWRALPREAVSEGLVRVGAALGGSREVVAYALAVVEAPRDERVQLWLGASGAAKVFVNGALALADPGYHPARLDQRGAWVSLRKGPNRILVKLCHEAGEMGFHLRLADERGEGRVLPAGDPAAEPPAAGAAPTPIAGAVAELERRVADARGRPRAEAEARLELALALAERRSADAGEGREAAEARRAVELAPAWVEARLAAARLTDERGRRRAHVEAALAAAPEDARALLALADDELERDRPHAAVRLLERAVRAAPGLAAPRVRLAEALDRAGLDVRGALAAEAAARDFPTVPGAVRAAARAARRLGRVDEAAARYRTLLALRLDDRAARAALAQLLLERGDVAGAAALGQEGLRLDPWDVGGRLDLADLLAANGRIADAEAQFEGALRIAPDDPEPHARRGRCRLAQGRLAEAKPDLERALELRPQSPELKELVRSLEPARERFERPYLADVAALARAAPGDADGDDAVILADVEVTRVFPSGLSATYEQLVVKVLNQRGADAFRRRAVSWDPQRQEVTVERARVHKADGTVVDTHDESDQSASEPWYRLYYDTRAKSLSFPALAPGDVLELAWRVEDVARENLLSDYYGDLAFVDEPTRKVRFDRVVLVPEGRKLHAHVPSGVARTERALGGGVVEHRFVATDVPRVVAEPAMPGWSEIARFVHVSTYASWDEVARFYWGLVREQLRPTEDVKLAARRIAEEAIAPAAPRPDAAPTQPAALPSPAAGWDLATKRVVVAAVYDFVVTQTRYVGLEFGIHGYKPYRVDDVLRRRFGDCKDKASLMHALLASLGIDSRLVLLRMRRLGRIPEAPASLAVFNHAILWVPELDLWLDGTASWSGSRELPAEDRGATALVVNPDGPPRFVTVPEATPEQNRTESRFEVSVAPDGRAVVRGSSRIAGAQAPEYRRAYLSAHDRRAQLEKAFNRTFPGLRVQEVTLSDVARIEEDVRLEFTLEVPRYAQPDAGGLRFTPFGAGAGYLETYASLSERRHPLVVGEPMENRFEYRYALPPGWTAVDLPEDAHGEVPEAAFQVHHRLEGATLVVSGQVTLRAGRVAPERYPAFRALAARLDGAFARRVRIAPAAVPPPPSPGGAPEATPVVPAAREVAP
jgi:tetratricopeptide (TPR) repeat protein/transglutaminase-like putative cysteine protease